MEELTDKEIKAVDIIVEAIDGDFLKSDIGIMLEKELVAYDESTAKLINKIEKYYGFKYKNDDSNVFYSILNALIKIIIHIRMDGSLSFKLPVEYKQFKFIRTIFYVNVRKTYKELQQIIDVFNVGYNDENGKVYRFKYISKSKKDDAEIILRDISEIYYKTHNNKKWFEKVDLLMYSLKEIIKKEEKAK